MEKRVKKVLLVLLIIWFFGIPFYVRCKGLVAIKVAAEYLAEKYEAEMEYIPGSMEPITLGDSAWDFDMKFQTKETKIPFEVGIAFDLKPHSYKGEVYIPWDGYIGSRFYYVAENDIQNLLVQSQLDDLIDKVDFHRAKNATLIFGDLDEAMSQEEMAWVMRTEYVIDFYFSSSALAGQEEETVAQNILALLNTMKNSSYTPDTLQITCEEPNLSMVLSDWQSIDTTEEVLALMRQG